MRKFSLVALILACFFISSPAFSANKQLIEQKIKNLSETLKEKKNDYLKIRKQYKDLMVQIESTDRSIKLLKGKIKQAKRGLKIINRKIKEIKEEIGDVSGRLFAQRDTLQKELKSYYEYSLLSPYYLSGVWYNTMNGYVTNYIQSRIKDYMDRRAYLKRRMEQLNSYRLAKQRLINEIKFQQDNLKSQMDRLKSLAQEANMKKQEYLLQIERIVKQQENLKKLLKRIIEEEKRRKELLARRKKMEKSRINTKLIVSGSPSFLKKIPPPVSGRVVGYFGRKYDPLFKVYTRNDGIDIEAKRGSCVRAVAYGKIDFVGNLPGYGGVVIINHLNGYYTVYGGLRCFYRVGKIVKAYQCIGKMTSTKLHFEIRRHATPLNPLNYIDRRLLK